MLKSDNQTKYVWLTLSLPDSNLESIKINVVVAFESVDETLVCDHSNESYQAVLSIGAVCFWQFYKMKFKIFSLRLLGVKGLKTEELLVRQFTYCTFLRTDRVLRNVLH